MDDKKSVAPSVESIARANRKRLAVEEGARAMADRDRQAIDVRKNMERLRELRQIREAEEAKNQPALVKAGKTTQRKKKTLE